MAETAIIYNITYKIAHSIEEEWLQWMRTKHVLAILATKCFYKAQFLKLKEDIPDEEGATYAVQYHATNFANYERYISQHQDHFKEESYQHWGDKFIAFRTILEVVD